MREPMDIARAAARMMAETRLQVEQTSPSWKWEQEVMPRYEELKAAALAEGTGTDGPAWKAWGQFLEECKTEAARRGVHTPVYIDLMRSATLRYGPEAMAEFRRAVRREQARKDRE